MIKGNYGYSYQQSINEVIATMIHQRQKQVPYTEYQLCTIDTTEGEGLGCMCENFASEELEFISAYEVAGSVKKRNDVNEFEHFINVCHENGLDREQVRAFLEYQILTDFIITNTDRHFNNFGILRDTNTLRFVGIAPLFDSGNSLFWNNPRLPLTDDLMDIGTTSFQKTEIKLLRYVKGASAVRIDLLPEVSELKELLLKDVDADRRIEGVLTGYQKKIELLKKIQCGERC